MNFETLKKTLQNLCYLEDKLSRLEQALSSCASEEKSGIGLDLRQTQIEYRDFLSKWKALIPGATENCQELEIGQALTYHQLYRNDYVQLQCIVSWIGEKKINVHFLEAAPFQGAMDFPYKFSRQG